jgi:hypothetical protein
VSEGYTNVLPPQLRDMNASYPGVNNPNRHNPNAGLNDTRENTRSFFASADMEDELREVYDAANRNNVAIYALSPRGLSTGEFDMDQATVAFRTSQQYLTSTQNTLRTLAEESDGRAIVNRNDFGTAMKQIVRDSSAYYLLGYASPHAPTDGQFHQIAVRVKRPGVQVRSRRGYWAATTADLARANAPKPAPATPLSTAVAAIADPVPVRSRLIRTWIGTSRAENGKTKVTFVWEAMPDVAGNRPRDAPSRVLLTAVAPDGAPYFRGRVPAAASGSSQSATSSTPSPPRAPVRASFDAAPGPMELRVSIEGVSAEVLDSETREITVPDLTGAGIVLGTPSVLRARTVRELQQLKADPAAVPLVTREFARTDRLLVRVPAYGPEGAPPALDVRLLNRSGKAVNDLAAAPEGGPNVQQIELPLAGLAPGEYVIEIKPRSGDSGMQLVAFRVTG